MRDYGEVETNKYGTNKKIKGNILSKEEMTNAGFCENYHEGTKHEHYSEYWFRNRILKLPNKFKGIEISFDVCIDKDSSEVRIDVLDEAFCQPYDYQHMLSNRDNPPALAVIVDQLVEKQMELLQEAGILSGHIKGEYI